MLGANDGVLSTSSLVIGIAASNVIHGAILVSGVADLVAGSMSMAAGEYVSVSSQSDTEKADTDVERRELAEDELGERAELAAIYRRRGLRAGLAKEVARQLSVDPEQAWRVHAREELGVDPDDLPSPWVAAGSSFVAFGLGAVLPLLPYLVGATTLLWSVVLGKFGPREMNAFWATLFMFGYAMAGLWFGRAFIALGLGITALTMAGYFWAGPLFEPYMAVVDGGGLVLCGLLMRRA